jgi:uncharacterized membrane protein YkoI
MNKKPQIYILIALVAAMAVALPAAAIARSGGDSDPAVHDGAAAAQETAAPQATDDADDDDDVDDDAGEPEDDDADDLDDDADDADDAEDENEAPGQLSEGAELLPQAGITLEEAVAAAQAQAQALGITGELGEVELEDEDGKLVFSVEIGDEDIEVDAQTGEAIADEEEDVDADDDGTETDDAEDAAEEAGEPDDADEPDDDADDDD